MLTDNEEKCLKETRLRNLKRKYARIKEHADLMDVASDLRKEISNLEDEIKLM